ncbi:hypothetical protein SGPA1_20676 [Streptomyces misionensis JCM 4497]
MLRDRHRWSAQSRHEPSLLSACPEGLHPPVRRWFTSGGASPTVTRGDEYLALGYSESGTPCRSRRRTSDAGRGKKRCRPLARKPCWGRPSGPSPRTSRPAPRAARRTRDRAGLEQRRVISAGRAAFRHLPDSVAARRVTADVARGHVPRAGCQVCPGYVARPARNASPADAVVALTANFSAWIGSCVRTATGLRTRYGLPDTARAFFDLFAAPSPEPDRQATAAVRAALDAGTPEGSMRTGAAADVRGAVPGRSRRSPTGNRRGGFLRRSAAVGDARHVDPVRQLRQLDRQRGDGVLVQPPLPGLDQPQPPPAHGPQQLAHIGRGHLQGPAVVDDQRQSHFAVHKRGW